MRTIDFNLDARLQADTHHVASLPLCEVLLMNDARYAWLILVPRRNGLTEIIDLPENTQQELWREINHVAQVLCDAVPCDKLNIGALGNIVRQLHVHVIARKEGDPAWPGPVWGHSSAQPYTDNERQLRIALLQQHLSGDAA
jgi:diadenosine tetraphosphate (Ap4A) HIT family hydrolase